MKKIITRTMIAVALCALVSALAIAKDKSEMVTIPQDVVINGTLVKRGDYKLKFDEQSGELQLLKGKKVVARTTARLEQRDEKAQRTEFRTFRQGDARLLKSITFRGDRESLVMHEAGAPMSAPAAAAPGATNSNP